MASKDAFYSTTPEPTTELMRFRIPGMRAAYGEDGVFEIEAKPLHLNIEPVGEMLEGAGIEREEATVYAERFYRMVQTGELARLIAGRMERIG